MIQIPVKLGAVSENEIFMNLTVALEEEEFKVSPLAHGSRMERMKQGAGSVALELTDF